jgi:hypothetical protein
VGRGGRRVGPTPLPGPRLGRALVNFMQVVFEGEREREVQEEPANGRFQIPGISMDAVQLVALSPSAV